MAPLPPGMGGLQILNTLLSSQDAQNMILREMQRLELRKEDLKANMSTLHKYVLTIFCLYCRQLWIEQKEKKLMLSKTSKMCKKIIKQNRTESTKIAMLYGSNTPKLKSALSQLKYLEMYYQIHAKRLKKRMKDSFFKRILCVYWVFDRLVHKLDAKIKEKMQCVDSQIVRLQQQQPQFKGVIKEEKERETSSVHSGLSDLKKDLNELRMEVDVDDAEENTKADGNNNVNNGQTLSESDLRRLQALINSTQQKYPCVNSHNNGNQVLQELAAAINTNMSNGPQRQQQQQQQNMVILQPANIQQILVQNSLVISSLCMLCMCMCVGLSMLYIGNVGMLLMSGLNGGTYGRQVTGYNVGNNGNGNTYYYDSNGGGNGQQSNGYSHHCQTSYCAANNYNQSGTSLNTGLFAAGNNSNNNNNGQQQFSSLHNQHIYDPYQSTEDQQQQQQQNKKKTRPNMSSMMVNQNQPQQQSSQSALFPSAMFQQQNVEQNNHCCNGHNCANNYQQQRMCPPPNHHMNPQNLPPSVSVPCNITLPQFNLNGINMNNNNNHNQMHHAHAQNMSTTYQFGHNLNQFNMHNLNMLNMQPQMNNNNNHNHPHQMNMNNAQNMNLPPSISSNMQFNGNQCQNNSCCSNPHCANNQNMNNCNNNYMNANSNLYFPVIATPAAPNIEMHNFSNSNAPKTNHQTSQNQATNNMTIYTPNQQNSLSSLPTFSSGNTMTNGPFTNQSSCQSNVITLTSSSNCSLTPSQCVTNDLPMKQSPKLLSPFSSSHNSSPPHIIDLNHASDSSLNSMFPPPLQQVKEYDSLNSSDTGTITPPQSSISMPAIVIKTDNNNETTTKGNEDEKIEHQKIICHEVAANKKQYQCTICNSHWFSSQEALNRHTKTHEIMKSTTQRRSGDPNRPWQCEICKRNFAEKCTLKRHIRIHTNEKPWKCQYCSKAFNQSCSLQAHIRIHTGERPFPCTFCEKRFRQSTHRRQHMKRVHKEQWESMQQAKKKKK